MQTKFIAIAGIILIIVGIGAWYQTSHTPSAPQPQVTDYKGLLVANMGSMKCYMYTENVTTTSDGKTTHSTISGGYNNGTYFFHGKNSKMEWWVVIRGTKFIENVSQDGKNATIQMNLTKTEVQEMLRYDPVKLGLRTLGSGTTVKSDSSVVIVNYTIYVPYKEKTAMMNGQTKVNLKKDYNPETIDISGTISSGGKVLEKLHISSIVQTCSNVPKWVSQLEGVKK